MTKQVLCDPAGVEVSGLAFPGVFDPRLTSVTPAGVGPGQTARCESSQQGVSNAGWIEPTTRSFAPRTAVATELGPAMCGCGTLPQKGRSPGGRPFIAKEAMQHKASYWRIIDLRWVCRCEGRIS